MFRQVLILLRFQLAVPGLSDLSQETPPLEFLSLANHVAVYFPQSYNFAGSVLILPSNQVTPPESQENNRKIFYFGRKPGFLFIIQLTNCSNISNTKLEKNA
jgi:hypothetical protein